MLVGMDIEPLDGKVLRALDNPIHATGVGLLLYSKQAQEAKAEATAAKLGFSNAFERMKTWFQKNF